mmetsp:Transcript_33207/g.71749  ORF Transcript_33207/g.71749 Transcript_33207/m.71749 type:complete len:1011 (-) Transcript_33207:218-3250(-)
MATTTTSHTSPSPHNNGSISSPHESVRSSSITNSHRSLKRTPSTLQRNNFARSGLDSDVKLTDEEIELVLADLAQTETNIIDQTWSRYFVEKYFSHYKWYNPNRDVEGAPSIRKGWAYFEHFTLPRRYKEKVGGHRTRSPPGEGDENTTKLYSYFGTGEQSLSDWGIGMSMYFASLRSTAFILIFVGALNVVNILYYSSDDYDQGPGLLKFDISLSAMLQYSAVCTDREWVVCANPDGADACGDSGEWDTIFTKKYYGTAIDDSNDGKKVTLIHRTTCDMAELLPGVINYTTLMILILLLTLYMWYLGKRELRFDEDNTTPSDYTLVVRNPPKDAVDPDEWRDFFSTFSDKSVTLCTVALNNGPLVAKLVTRRELLKTLKQRLLGGAEIGVDFDERDVDTAVENARRYREGEEAKRNCLIKLPSCIFTTLQQRCLGKGLTESMLWERIKNTTKEIEELQKAEYKAAAVFVTFETELGQRTALEALNASELEILTNVATNLDATALFRGEVVLRVEEASEPNSVRWKDLHTNTISRYLSQIITMAITTGLVSLSGYVLYLTRLTVDTFAFAIILSALNSIIPIVLRSLVSFEKHYDEGAVQRSFYINITFFRWVNTAIITRIVTPTLATIGAEKIDLINTVNSMMISEMVVSPMLRYLDFYTILEMHYFAPRAKTEEEMLSYFTGGWYNLAERFTDFTKVLLLCTFFGTFYPLMYFLGAGILFFQYWMDKFLLLRSWQRAPYFGARTSRFSRIYFNSLALMLGVFSSAYAYFKSSFTMLCSCDANNKECILPDTQAFTNVELNDGTIIGTTTPIVPSREGFYFCNQDIHEFPPLPIVQGPDKWMTDSQEMLSNIYGMTCLVMLIIYCVLIFGKQTVKAVVSLMKGVYKPSGCNQNKDFSCGIGVVSFGYVPQLMEVPGYHFPLLICDIDAIDVGLMGWKDPNRRDEVDPHRSYDNHNLIFDVPHETLQRSRNEAVIKRTKSDAEKKGRPIFSVVKHYPPEWALRARENQQS